MQLPSRRYLVLAGGAGGSGRTSALDQLHRVRSYLEHKSRVNTLITRRFAAAEIEFAFPTQTIELTRSEEWREEIADRREQQSETSRNIADRKSEVSDNEQPAESRLASQHN